MDPNITIRILIFLFALVATWLTVRLTRIPKDKLATITTYAGIAGVINLLVDIPQQTLDFWQYRGDFLWLGLFPLDLYLAVSIGIGIGLVSLAWYIRHYFPKALPWFLLLTPVYFYLQDMAFIHISDDLFLEITSPGAYASDLIGVTIITLGTLVLTRRFWHTRN